MDSLKYQVGGDHYQCRKIQPIEFALANDLGFCEGCVIKYVTRWRDKGGVEDLEKAMHYLQFLIEDAKNNKLAVEDIALATSATSSEFSWSVPTNGITEPYPDNT